MTDRIVDDLKVLRQVSRETTEREVRELDLAARLRAANATAWTRGVGLAAIQIGVPLRFAWFVFEGQEETLLNPKILSRSGTLRQDEGCLSLPKAWFTTSRAETITYLSHGKRRSATGFKARIIQHEIDHMDGLLINR